MRTWTTAFLSHLPPERRRKEHELSAIEEALSRQVAVARAEWPLPGFDETLLIQTLAETAALRPNEPLHEIVDHAFASDLYWATACRIDVPGARETFYAAHFPKLRRTLARAGYTPSIIDETEQQLLLSLFVETNKKPIIGAYQGRGRIQGWLRSIAVRMAARIAGDTVSHRPEDSPEVLAAAIADPELEAMQRTYRDAVKHAFSNALTALAPREKNVLRQYHIDRLTIDELGQLYQVNRSTAARWVVAARERVLEITKSQLKESLRLSEVEIDSIIRLVRSQLDVSLRELA